MNYVRTFFEKPLANADRGSILAIDFSRIDFVVTEKGWLLISFRSGTQVRLSSESDKDFFAVFEEYCRDRQSLERGPVRLGRAGAPPRPTKTSARTE